MSALDPRSRTRFWNRLGLVVGVTGTLLAGLSWLSPVHLVIQARSEQSVPFRLGRTAPIPATWAHGEYVQFRTRDLRPYYPAGTPFTKIVGGVPGDRLTVDGRTFFINDTLLATARTTDRMGRPAWLYHPVPGPDGLCRPPETPATGRTTCTLPPGTLFVFGTHERSFDSRYWGPVVAAEVMSRVIPLW
jgi:conjugal transfer pilin signal peptidase TrbI